MLRLYTFDISHFSEKARWALDYEGVAYEEKVLVPGPHQLVTRRIARKTSVPVLEHDGHVVQGSSAILDYLAGPLGATKLAPRDADGLARAHEMERMVDKAFGLGAQRVLYSEFLKHRAAVTALWSANGPRWAPWFYAAAYPVVASVVARMYGTADPALVAEAKRAFIEACDVLDPILARQPYLGGESPGRVDITVAALLAPVCRPREHRVKWPDVVPELREFVDTLASRATYAHALRMYARHRAPLG